MDVVTAELLGPQGRDIPRVLDDRKGILYQAAARYFGRIDWLAKQFELHPDSELPPDEER